MDPALTCLDKATWLKDFNAEDIVVGATIGFNPNCWEDEPDDLFTAHRVMDIKIENGVYYFWPKGDANPEDDGCWVHQDNVSRYLVGVEKNAVPENAYLQSQVRAASEAYEKLLLRYCGHTIARNCTLRGDIYQITIDAYHLWRCWHRNAEESERPGHIPHEC